MRDVEDLIPLEGTDLRVRPAGEEDIPLLARLYSETFPIDAKGPEVFGHHYRELRPGFTAEYAVLELGGSPVGAVYIEHPSWELQPERFAYLMVMLPGPAMTVKRYRAAQRHLEARAAQRGALVMTTQIVEDRTDLARLLMEMGWERERLDKAWQLDLVAHREALLATAERTRAAMREQGIDLRTLAADMAADRGAMAKLHAFHERAVRDMPRTEPVVPKPFDEWMRRWRQPDLFADRFWLAKDGDRTVAASHLRFPPSLTPVWTGFTATEREYRGRGIARAVKMETLAQAIGLGIALVRTDNDESNAPMLRINHTLGYERIPGWLEFKKAAGDAVAGGA